MITFQLTSFFPMALKSTWVLNKDEIQTCTWDDVLSGCLLSPKLIHLVSVPHWLSSNFTCPKQNSCVYPPNFLLLLPLSSKNRQSNFFSSSHSWFISFHLPTLASSGSKLTFNLWVILKLKCSVYLYILLFPLPPPPLPLHAVNPHLLPGLLQ